jgi:ankyrin repeat protein
LLNFVEGADELLLRKAPVDQANRRGETPLILAVQSRNTSMVQLLVRKGANPDKRDHAAGMSARDYARRDDRTGSLLAALDSKAESPVRDNSAVFGPK